MVSQRGTLVVFEGLDKAGKSTQCERLVKALQVADRPVRHVRFPDRTTPIGIMIDKYLKGQDEQEDHVIHLLFSANRWEAAYDQNGNPYLSKRAAEAYSRKQIDSDIEAGTTVIVDRYSYSGCVYSAAKRNPALTLEWSRKCDEGLPRPDVCIFLDISPQDAAKRGGYGDEKYEKQEMQDTVRGLFKQLRSSPDGEDFVVVDGGRPLEQVEADVADVVRRTDERIKTTNESLRRIRPW